jgi:hypothetical protein
MGPWGHVIPDGSPFSPIDFRAIALRWWDHWLRGVDDGLMDERPVSVHVQGADPEWRGLSSWPPSEDVVDRLDLSAERGQLRNLASHGTDDHGRYVPDPRVGPYSGIQCIGASSRLVLPLDQHTDDTRSCALTSDPVDRDTLICGRPEVELRLDLDTADRPSVERVVLRLTDVDPAGRSVMISTCLMTNAPAGEPFSLEFWPTAYRLAAGHRLRVVVSDSAFPWLVPVADPQPFTLRALGLRVPVLHDSGGSMKVPEIPVPVSGMTFTEGSWAIDEHPGKDGLGLRMWSRRDYTAPEGHRLREDSSSEAFVVRARPADVVYRGDRSIVATMRSGEVIEVRARVNTTHGVMIADADVTIGGVRAFTQQWSVPLSL